LKNARRFEALVRADERFKKAFDASPTAMSILRVRDGVILDVNESANRISGYSREEQIGRTPAELGILTSEEREELGGLARRQASLRDHEMKYRVKDGPPRTVRVSVEKIELDGEACLLYNSYDITDRRLAEDQVRHAQKMEALGTLAGGIAHDFNNLLTVINGYAHLLAQQVPDESTRESALAIVDAGDRAAALTRQLLAYSRKQPRETRTLSLNTIVTKMRPMLTRLIHENIPLRAELAPDLASVRADTSQLEQILLNLVVNARDASPAGGAIVIKTANISEDDAAGLADANMPSGRPVLLSVRDEGRGMTPEIRARIFEPFFTTKQADRGTGLGLSVVFGIIRQSGGAIQVDSEPGKGTEVRLYFPAVPPAPVIAAPAPVDERDLDAGPDEGTVLLVEDDVAVRKFGADALSAAGFNVRQASNGTEAVNFIERAGGDVSLVITDVIMPGLDGRALLEHVRRVAPAVPVLLVSGYLGVAQDLDVPFLEKPFSAAQLVQKARQAIRRC
ncbi:MAG TPA: ATP-binding protein, partial [Polyangia bacterium]|nr:ATP-binding protein [Polyangia bacterium]